MRLSSAMGAVLLSAALAITPGADAGAGAVAFAEDAGSACTVTLELPATVEAGHPFMLHVDESSGCAGATGLQPFTVDDHLTDGTLRWGYAGIGFSHTPGTGDADYQGIAPAAGTWRPRVRDAADVAGYTVAVTSMVATPQVVPTPTTPAAKAVWVNDTLRIAYPYATTFGDGVDESWRVLVDGRVVGDALPRHRGWAAIEVRRTVSEGPAKVQIVGTSFDDDDPFESVADTLTYSATIDRRVVKAKSGQVSAATMLDQLEVRDETHATSFSSTRFGSWLDADHDGESTRVEVLKSESSTKPVVSHGSVTTGSWLSRFDGRALSHASQLVVDHLVPLREAWTSGAAAWSARKRAAYANDLAYGPSLIAVSAAAHRARGARDITAYLPSNASYRCAYVRNWIAVKHRWGLAVDPAEKTALHADLTLYCSDPYVTKPTAPDVAALVD